MDGNCVVSIHLRINLSSLPDVALRSSLPLPRAFIRGVKLPVFRVLLLASSAGGTAAFLRGLSVLSGFLTLLFGCRRSGFCAFSAPGSREQKFDEEDGHHGGEQARSQEVSRKTLRLALEHTQSL